MGCCGCGEDETENQEVPKGTNKVRGCTDVICLALFVVFWLLMILIAAFALVYGNPLRLRNGYDSYGNTCGVSKNTKIGELALSGLDTSDKPFLFYLDVKNLRHSLQICVKQCPDRTINTLQDLKNFYNRTGSSLCTYDFNITALDDKFINSADSLMKPIGPCPPMPVPNSGSVLHRCVPKSVSDFASLGVGNIYDLLNSWDTIEQVLSDVYDTWEVILALCFLALVLSLFMVAVLHFVASFVAWIFMIAVSIACVFITGVLWWTFFEIKWKLETTQDDLLDKAINNESAFLVYSIIATIFTVIILLLVLALRNRIGFLAQLFRESSECLTDMPYLILQPFVTFAILIAFFAFWVSVMVCLATATYPGSKSLSLSYESTNAPGITTSQYTALGDNPTSRIGNVSLGQLKVFKLVEFVDATWVKYMWWVYVIGLIWTSEFILACQQMVIAGAVAIWYFDGGRKSVGSPVKTSITNLVSYHLGSLALGSLLITILKIPRLLLTYIYSKFKKNEESSDCARCGLKCCICCFYCLEKCVRYMNHNAYTVIAIQGINFCSAARRAFTVLVSNALQLATLNCIGDFILFLGKCFVMAATGSVGLLLLKRDPNLKFFAIPVLVIAIFSFLIAHCVLSIYEVVIDTLFLCMCEDHSMNGEAGSWKKSTVVELHQQALAKKKNRTDGDQDEPDQHTQHTIDEDSSQPAELTPINET